MLLRVAPSTLTAMHWDDSSICITTSARAGTGHDMAVGDQTIAIVALVEACRFHATLLPLE
jgi:hypothetical protein